MKNQHEVEKLAYAMTRQRYLLNRDIVHDLFTELSLSDYIALHSIAEAAGQGAEAEQTYLRDLAERLEMPMPKTSKMIRKLHERGLVFWSHSGDGRDGTYVVITDSGLRAMERQANILNAYYSRAFGCENLKSLLEQISRLEDVMNEVFTKGAASHGLDPVK
jgi:DNA-binding MarR family transcriptional regulator